MLKCNFVFHGMCLSTFSHDAVRILASPESIAGGAPKCKTRELALNLSAAIPQTQYVRFVSKLNIKLNLHFSL